MNELKVKAEYAPQRCEVCHQVDNFIAELNYCHRCNEIAHFFDSKNIDWKESFGNATFIGTITAIFNCILVLFFLLFQSYSQLDKTLIAISSVITVVFIIVGILSSSINSNYLTKTRVERINSPFYQIIDWIACLILSSTFSGLLLASVSVFLGLVIAPTDIKLIVLFGLIAGVIIGGMNSGVNSIFLIKQRTELFNATTDQIDQ